MRYTVLAIICCAVALGGCGGTTPPLVSYDKQGRKTAGQPDYITVLAGANCSGRMGDAPLSVRKSWADMMNVPITSLPKLMCQRLDRALYAGKLTDAEYRSVMGAGNVTPKTLKILRGG